MFSRDSGGDLRTVQAAEAENACNKVNGQKVDGETAQPGRGLADEEAHQSIFSVEILSTAGLSSGWRLRRRG